ncbi:hypothetical protein Q5752_005785 [Cryptotrichosporon argae]
MPSCQCCRQDKQQLYCAKCLCEGIATNDALSRKVDGQRTDAERRAGLALNVAGSRGEFALRRLKAEISAGERRCAALRDRLAAREAEISGVRTSPPPNYPRPTHVAAWHSLQRKRSALEKSIDENAKQQQDVAKRLIHARRVLVREAIEVFGVLEGRHGWEIAGAVLPSPESFRLHSSLQINAALTHTIHLVSLLTSYLGLALPFLPHYPTRTHIGRPLVSPNLPFVSTTKFRDRHVLWMSSTASVAKRKSASTTGSNLRSSVLGGLGSFAAAPAPAPQPAVIDKARASKHRDTLVAFALFAHSIAYLAWSQGVPGIGIEEDATSESDEPFEPDPNSLHQSMTDAANPFNDPPEKKQADLQASRTAARARTPRQSSVLLPATQPLPLLAALADSPTLGHRTHEPAGPDVTVRHLGFNLDVGKLVSSVLDIEGKKWGRKEEEGSEWDLVEGDGA